MKIQRIKSNTIKWNSKRGKNSKYRPLYDKIRGLKVGEALKVTLETKRILSNSIWQALRKDRKYNNKIELVVRSLDGLNSNSSSKIWGIKRVK